MIALFFLVLLHATVELVRERVDGGVHVIVHRVREDLATAQEDGRLCFVPNFLFHAKDAVHVEDAVGVSHDTVEFLLDVVLHRSGDLYVMTRDMQLHERLLRL